MTTEQQNELDAKRYRFLRKISRSHRKIVCLSFAWPQNDKWPEQHAFLDFDSAVDEAMSEKNKI